MHVHDHSNQQKKLILETMLEKVMRQQFVGNSSYIKDDVTLTYWLKKTVKLQFINLFARKYTKHCLLQHINNYVDDELHILSGKETQIETMLITTNFLPPQ